jgi:hypothetical protein
LDFTRVTLIINFAATWYMVGLIWFVQVVHYPLFSFAAKDNFVNFEQAHSSLTSLVVGPPMLVELITAILMVALAANSQKRMISGVALLLLVIVWCSTAFLQIPAHNKLGAGFDSGAHGTLVATNWIRTVSWSARGLILAYLML